MRYISVKGIDVVQGQLSQYAKEIRDKISSIIFNVGNQVVSELKIKYPDLLISSNFYPQSLEYWITISKIGKDLKWIKCPITPMFFSKDKDGSKQQFRSDILTLNEEDIKKIITTIAEKLSSQIKSEIGV